jgi:ABC-type polar amino acid transport system ATPase subunit
MNAESRADGQSAFSIASARTKVGCLSLETFRRATAARGDCAQSGDAAEVMLYDEPTSQLDPSSCDEVFSVMRELDNEGMTQIVVTHHEQFCERKRPQCSTISGRHVYVERTRFMLIDSNRG